VVRLGRCIGEVGRDVGPMWKEEMRQGKKSRLIDCGKLGLKSKGNIETSF
jgi:hypothetical protein